MQRYPWEEVMKDPDKKAKLFVWITKAMVITTFLITLGGLIFVAHVVGLI